jgi:hypothetical protein
MLKVNVVKVAWIANASLNDGRGLGNFNCPCGKAPATMFDESQGNVTCNCGALYTWDGWLLDPITKKEIAFDH